MSRVLGLDYGKRRVGVALSDPLNMFATGLQTVPNQSVKQVIQDIQAILKQYGIQVVVIGLPIRTTGEPGDTAPDIRVFGDKLAELTQCEVVYEDERYTTVIAQQSLREQGIKPSRQKDLIDRTAAALILQQYLDKQSRLSGSGGLTSYGEQRKEDLNG